MKKRLDVLLVEKGLAPTRERAQRLIMAAQVLVEDVPVTKSGHSVDVDAAIRVRGEDHPYVSRGGLKLAQALDVFKISVEGRVGLDIGASTGGFTHVLLLRGAQEVFAVDVGHNQMDWKIRQDPRVRVFEKVNARSLPFESIGRTVDLIVIDVAFISLDKILPAMLPFMTPQTDLIALIKPQFEVGREKVGKGGIVQDPQDRLDSVERLKQVAETLGLERQGLIESPITGMDGNQEFLAHWKRFERI